MKARYTCYTLQSIKNFPMAHNIAIIGCQGPSQTPIKLIETAKDIRLDSGKLSVLANRSSGALTFLSPDGKTILAEPQNGGKAMQQATVNHVDTYHVEQDFLSPPDEALYGMAEGQDGVWNWRGMPIDLVNENIVGALPVMISSRWLRTRLGQRVANGIQSNELG